MPKTSYRLTSLYGGAIVCDLPESFADVSQLRQVPDHQEVWIDKNGFTTIIFEITERVGPQDSSVESDGRALSTHLEDIVDSDKDTVRVWNTSETEFSQVEDNPRAYTLIATQQPTARDASGKAPGFTALVVTLLRLEKQSTDLLVTVNVPHIRGEYDEEEVDLEMGKQGKLIGNAVEHVARIWASFNIKDWGLFKEM